MFRFKLDRDAELTFKISFKATDFGHDGIFCTGVRHRLTDHDRGDALFTHELGNIRKKHTVIGKNGVRQGDVSLLVGESDPDAVSAVVDTHEPHNDLERGDDGGSAEENDAEENRGNHYPYDHHRIAHVRTIAQFCRLDRVVYWMSGGV